MKLIKAVIYSLMFLFSYSFVVASPNVNDKVYKIGLPQVPGIMWKNEKGLPTGFHLEIVEVLLAECYVQYVWVEGSWPQLFDAVSKGEIDLLPGTQISDERRQYLDFIEPGLYTMWSEFYIEKGTKLKNPHQLNGQKVGIVRSDNNGTEFIRYIEKFNIQIELVNYDSHLEAIEGLDNGEIRGFAGPKQRNNSDLFANVLSSGLFYNPSESSISFPKGKNSELLILLGGKLEELKDDPNSMYYELYRKYNITSFDINTQQLSQGVKLVLLIALIIIMGGIFFVLLLRSEVSRKTNELKKSKEKAEQSERLKSAFIANMSHEIRTPLNSIVGFSELLVDFDLTDEQKQKYAVIIKKQNQILLNVINDVIDISKIESGNMKVVSKPISISSFLSEQFESTKVIFDESFQFQLNIDPLVMNSLINIDEMRLAQILNNFLTNTQKYTHGGLVELGVRFWNNYFTFYVTDSGPGLTKKQMDVIFDRFHKENNFEQGAGLGLAICKSLAKLLGGEIQVESSVEKGSTFMFVIAASEQKG